MLLTMAALLLAACGEEITVPDFGTYVAVRSDYATTEETVPSIALKKHFAAAGMELKLTTDWDSDSASAPAAEIIVGDANRVEYGQFKEKLAHPDRSAAYGMIGEKIVLYAPTTEGLSDIVDRFAADMLTGAPTVSLKDGSVYEFTVSEQLCRTDGGEIMNTLDTKKLWGINAHHKGFPTYGATDAKEHVRLAAELGSTIYRINFNPVTEEDVAYIGQIADWCHEYGMQVMLVLDRRTGTPEEIAERMTFTAKHLAGRIDYFQIFNETDIWCSKKDDGSFYNVSNWTGMTRDYYNPERVAICIENMQAALQAFRAEAPEAKLVVNIGSRHFPMLDFYVEAGLSWDIIAFDIYDLDLWDHAAFFEVMEKRYPGYDFMVAECNYPANSGAYTEEQQEAWLTAFLKVMSDYKSERMLGVMIYELLDEPNLQPDDKWSGEAHFGLVNTNADYSIAGPKRSYYAVQKLLCGGEASLDKVFTPVK